MSLAVGIALAVVLAGAAVAAALAAIRTVLRATSCPACHGADAACWACGGRGAIFVPDTPPESWPPRASAAGAPHANRP